MDFISSNSADINKYFNNTFVKVKEYGDLLFNITSVDKASVRGVTENGDDFAIYLDDKHPFHMDYILPHKSFFQHGKNACQLCRIPAQQYQRGLSMKNALVSQFRGGGDTGPAIPMGFEVLKAFVTKQEFFTLSKAYAHKGMVSCVLSPRMVYLRANQHVYMDFAPIAVVKANEEGRLTIKTLVPVFKQEIMDLLQQTNEQQLFSFV